VVGGLKVAVESFEGLGTLDHHGSSLCFVENFEELQDEDEDVLVLLFDQLVHQDGHDVERNYRIDTIGKLGDRDHGLVGVGADSHHFVVEKVSNLGNHLFFNQDGSALFGAGHFDDGS